MVCVYQYVRRACTVTNTALFADLPLVARSARVARLMTRQASLVFARTCLTLSKLLAAAWPGSVPQVHVFGLHEGGAKRADLHKSSSDGPHPTKHLRAPLLANVVLSNVWIRPHICSAARRVCELSAQSV